MSHLDEVLQEDLSTSFDKEWRGDGDDDEDDCSIDEFDESTFLIAEDTLPGASGETVEDAQALSGGSRGSSFSESEHRDEESANGSSCSALWKSAHQLLSANHNQPTSTENIVGLPEQQMHPQPHPKREPPKRIVFGLVTAPPPPQSAPTTVFGSLPEPQPSNIDMEYSEGGDNNFSARRLAPHNISNSPFNKTHARKLQLDSMRQRAKAARQGNRNRSPAAKGLIESPFGETPRGRGRRRLPAPEISRPNPSVNNNCKQRSPRKGRQRRASTASQEISVESDTDVSPMPTNSFTKTVDNNMGSCLRQINPPPPPFNMAAAYMAGFPPSMPFPPFAAMPGGMFPAGCAPPLIPMPFPPGAVSIGIDLGGPLPGQGRTHPSPLVPNYTQVNNYNINLDTARGDNVHRQITIGNQKISISSFKPGASGKGQCFCRLSDIPRVGGHAVDAAMERTFRNNRRQFGHPRWRIYPPGDIAYVKFSDSARAAKFAREFKNYLLINNHPKIRAQLCEEPQGFYSSNE